MKSKRKTTLTPKEEKLLYFYASIDAPYYFLPENIRVWLETVGLDMLKKEKPTLASWIESMRKDLTFPSDLGFTTVFYREVEKEMRKRGCLSEGEFINPSEVYNLIRYRYNPFFTKSERTICLAKSIYKLLKEKESQDREDISELARIVKNWININQRIRESR